MLFELRVCNLLKNNNKTKYGTLQVYVRFKRDKKLVIISNQKSEITMYNQKIKNILKIKNNQEQ